MQYDSQRSNDTAYNQISETPLTFGLGLHLHKSIWSKDLVELMPDLGLGISYNKTIEIENSIADSVTQRTNENKRVFIPSNIVKSVPIHFAIHNCDFKNEAADGKNEFHGTAQFVIKKSTFNALFPIKTDKSATKFKGNFLGMEKIAKPVPRNESFPDFNGKAMGNKRESYKKLDRT